MADFNELKRKVEIWAQNRGILFEGNEPKQIEKLEEEVEELKQSLINRDTFGTIDGIGDCLVVLINIAKLQKLDIVNCLDAAYEEIKDRTGKTENGIFIKD